MPIKFCNDCDKPLNKTEIQYYEYRCESCEREWSEAITMWRLGVEENKEFDKLYSIEKVIH